MLSQQDDNSKTKRKKGLIGFCCRAMGVISSCLKCCKGSGNNTKGKEYTKVHTNDLAMSALNSNGMDDEESGLQTHRPSGSGSDIDDEAWGVPSAAVRGGNSNTNNGGRMTASTPPAKSPSTWSTPSPDISPQVKPMAAPVDLPRPDPRGGGLYSPTTVTPPLPQSRPPLLDAPPAPVAVHTSTALTAPVVPVSPTSVAAAINPSAVTLAAPVEAPKPPEVDYFANMDMGITYQAPTTIVKKIPAKPIATYTNPTSTNTMNMDEYGLSQPAAPPSNRYNFDSLLGDEDGGNNGASSSVGGWGGDADLDLDLDLDGTGGGSSSRPAASSSSTTTAKKPARAKKESNKPAKKGKGLVAVQVVDDGSLDIDV